MKNRLLIMILAGLFMLPTAALQAQQQRTVTISLLNKKGKPVRDPAIIVYVQGDELTMTQLATGTASFAGLTDSDTLVMATGSDTYNIPVTGYKSISVGLLKGELYRVEMGEGGELAYLDSYKDPDPHDSNKAKASDGGDQSNYRHLAEYIRNRAPGLNIQGSGTSYSVKMRGQSSFRGNQEVLFVVDDVAIGNVNRAHDFVSISEIVSVTVLKDGSAYGTKGNGGVVLIRTKRASH